MSIGLEHEVHEVLTLALLVNLTAGDDIPGELSDGVSNSSLGLDGLGGEGSDPRGQAQNTNGHEGSMFTHHLILSPPGVSNLESIRSVTDSIEVVTECNADNNVHGRTGGVFYDVEFDGALARGMDLVGDARLESGGNMIDISALRGHCLTRTRER